MTKLKEITLDNLTSALKTVYGQETEATRLIFRHWAKRNYDIAQATTETLRKIDQGFLEKYQRAQPLERREALDLLNVYGETLLQDGDLWRTAGLRNRRGSYSA